MEKELVRTADAELVRQLASKDRQAYELLYTRYSAAMYGIINRIVLSEAEAGDVLQESFVKVWQNIDSYDASKGTFFTWLLNVCRNTAIDRRRSKSFRNNQKNQNIDNVVNLVEQRNETSFSVDHIGLKEVTAKLEEEYKVLIDLVYFDGYTQKEASEKLAIPLGTVKTRLRAAIVKLRKLI